MYPANSPIMAVFDHGFIKATKFLDIQNVIIYFLLMLKLLFTRLIKSYKGSFSLRDES